MSDRDKIVVHGVVLAIALAAIVMYDVGLNPLGITGFQTFGALQIGINNCTTLSSQGEYELTSSVSSGDTCMNITADNVQLDCAGRVILYNTDGGSNEYGVVAENRANITIKNCIIRDPNATGAFGIGINLTGIFNSSIINNSIFTNGTTENYGIQMQRNGSNVLIENNTIIAQGNESSNHGIFTIAGGGGNITIKYNNITALKGIGIELTAMDNTSVLGNFIRSEPGISGGSGGIGSFIRGAVIANNTIIAANSSAIDVGGNQPGSNVLNNTATVTGGTGLVIESSGHRAIGNTITINTNGSSRGVDVNTAFSNLIENNSITVNGGVGPQGMFFTAATANVTGNTISVNGTRAAGLRFDFHLGRISLTNNIVTVTGDPSSFVVSISDGSNATFFNTILNGTAQWINSTNASHQNQFNNFTNTTFQTGNGSLRIEGFFLLNGSKNITRSTLEVAFNRSYINSTEFPFLNQSAQITLRGLPFTDPRPIADFDDNGSFEGCPSSVCTEISYASGIFVFNVTRFSTYSSNQTTTNLTACTNLSTPGIYNLDSNVSSPGTCFGIATSSLELNCRGFTITYANVEEGYGVQAIGKTNVTIKNCIIVKTNATPSTSHGILFTQTNASFILNNYINATGGASDGIRLAPARDNLLANNTAIGQGVGIVLFALGEGPDNNTLLNNTGTSVSDAGLRIYGGENNSVTFGTYRSTSSNGIELIFGAARNALFNATGRSASGNALAFSSGGHRNVIINGTFIVGSGAAVRFQDGDNNLFYNASLSSGATWISADTSDTNNNFTGTEFWSENGSIRIIPNITFPQGTTLAVSSLNTTPNRAYLNATNASYLNTSALIMLRGINFSDPRPRVDFNDGGAFADCDPPQCNELGFSSSIFLFNVSGFTSYSSQDSVVGPNTCGSVSSSTTLNNSVSSNGTCFTITASNLVLDCAGHTINYSIQANGAGISAAGKENITIRNCVLVQTNASLPSLITGAYAINLSNARNITIQNNSILTLASVASGIRVEGDSRKIFAIGNRINVSKDSSDGIALSSTNESNLTYNVIETKYSTSSTAIQLSNSSLTAVSFNNITYNGTEAVSLDQTSNYNALTGNRIENKTSGSVGFSLTGSTGSTFTANFVVAGSDAFQAAGSEATYLSVSGNYFESGGGTSAILMIANASFSNVTSNTAVSRAAFGISVTGGSNFFYNNTLTHNGVSEGVAIDDYLGHVGNNVFMANTINASSDFGISISAGAQKNNLTLNSVVGFSGGIEVASANNSLVNNTATGTSGQGILLSSADENLLVENIASTQSSTSYGINLVSSSRNVLMRNRASAGTGTASIGLYVSAGGSNNFTDNLYVAGTGRSVLILSSPANRFVRDSVIGNGTYVQTSSAGGNIFSNLTFEVPLSGSARFLPSVTFPDDAIVNRTNLNVSSPSVFMNAANLTFLNTTARITLRIVGLTTPGVYFTANDTTSSICLPDRCNNTIYGGINLSFDVYRWTTYIGDDTFVPPQPASGALSSGTAGTAYSDSLSATEGKPPYTWSIVSGSLPPGLSLAANTGTISGTPTAEGAFSFDVQAADSIAVPQVGIASRSITIAAASGGGFGGGGGSGPTEPPPPPEPIGEQAAVISGSVQEGQASFSINVGRGSYRVNLTRLFGLLVQQIAFEALNPIPNGQISIVREDATEEITQAIQKQLPQQDLRTLVFPELASYSVLVSNIPRSSIGRVEHLLELSKDFIREFGIDVYNDVFIFRLTDDGKIEKLACTYRSESGSVVIFTCITPGFSLFALAAESPQLLCSVCETGQWSQCSNGRQTRAGNRCGPETNFSCQPAVEERACGDGAAPGAQPPGQQPPTALPIDNTLIIAIIALAGIVLLISGIAFAVFRSRGELSSYKVQ